MLFIGVGSAWAQAPVATTPSYVTTTGASGSISVTSTFQSVFAAVGAPGIGVTARQGCAIQNTGSNTMYVYIGAIANATKATSFQLVPPATGVQGGSFNCATGGGGVVQDQISITGTASDTFTATRQ